MQNTNAENSEQKYDMKLMMGMMDVVDALKAQQKEVEKQLNFEEQKEDIKKRLKATYEAMGTVVTDDQVETAITNYFSNLYTFKEPKKDFNYKIAQAYVNRGRIGKRYGIPALAVAGALSVALLANKGINEARQYAYERSINQQVQEVCQKKADFEVRLKEASSAKITQLPKTKEEDFYFRIKKSEKGLGGLGDFFEEFCLKDSKNKGKYKYLEQQLPSIKDVLSLIAADLTHSYDILELQKRIIVGKQNLENLITSIRTVAKEDIAIKKAEELYREAQSYIKIADIPALESYSNKLKSIDDVLLENYTLFVIGGKKRYPLDNPTHYNYYLIVQAKDKRGNVLTREMKNEETGNIEMVNKWGERVPEPIYRMVESDKKDNGIIDNNVFGKKETGYITERILFTDKNNNPLKRIGQITRWKQD